MSTNRKYTVEQLRDWAKICVGEFISKEYYGHEHPYKWRCEKGHVFEMRLQYLNQGAWCTVCSKLMGKEAELQVMHEWADERGGKCLSTKYENGRILLDWKCKNGHLFKASRNHLRDGTWCKICLREAYCENRLKELKKIASGKGGKCLSTEYTDNYSKMHWQCKLGHQWEAAAISIYNMHSWCPVCAGNFKHTIEDMHQLAKKNGGKCLSKKYNNVQTPLKWECKQKHIWTTPPLNIVDGSWCPTCGGREKFTLEEVKKIAKKKGGECLSKEYVNITTPLKWRCKNKHVFELKLANIIAYKNFCSQCYRIERGWPQFSKRKGKSKIKKT